MEEQQADPAPEPAKPESKDGTNEPPRLPPCDQCRRRKVKCDGKKIPCERCTQSKLQCTRDIARKKRGPKKGSGSVIAKLRDEHEHALVQETGLPPFDLSALGMEMSGIDRTYSNNSSLASTPLGSPIVSGFGDITSMPRSVPYDNAPATFAQGGIHFPASWQVPTSDLLQLSQPSSPSGYMTVNDLAQQIFQEPLAMPTSVNSAPPSVAAYSTRPTSMPRTLQPSPPKIDPIPPSIDAIMSNANTPHSPPTSTAASSPMPTYGPKYLYRSNSGPHSAERGLLALAGEIGMSAVLISQCIRQYFRHVYSIRPFIHEPTFSARLSTAEELTMEEKALILSLSAVVVLQDSPDVDLSLEKRHSLGERFLEHAILTRKRYDWIEHSTLSAIQTSYFICVALFELKRPRSHHFYLREAIGMAYDQNLHHESTYVRMDPLTAICAKRTFAILFVTERGLAILRNKSATIGSLPSVPTDFFDEADRMVLSGFTALSSLFALLDEKFIDLWRSDNTISNDTSSQDPVLANLTKLQHSLNNFRIDPTRLTPVQKADVFITHHWLRLIFWQASMRAGLVSSSSPDPVFFYNYPIVIASDLVAVIQNELSYEAIAVHGLGIFEKIFEVAYTLMDALTVVGAQWNESEELRSLFQVLASSPNSQNTYVKMLEGKADGVPQPHQSPIESPGSNGGAL